MTYAEWRTAERVHVERVDAATAGHRERRSRGAKHPVEDFLFTYYPFTPARLRRWHPGLGVDVEDAAALPRAQWRFYRTDGHAVRLDVQRFVTERATTIAFIRSLLTATASREPNLGCFGLHEWAMVYRVDPAKVRHDAWPLRLGSPGTDSVVESHPIRCTHFDAFRFFTPAAIPRNVVEPTRALQVELDQPGCLHAGMDLYKWAMKLAPMTPSDLVMDCFDLARELRTLDMRASPYDLHDLGYSPVMIETPEGKAEYVAAQRELGRRAQALRVRLVGILDALPPPQQGEGPETSYSIDRVVNSP